MRPDPIVPFRDRPLYVAPYPNDYTIAQARGIRAIVASGNPAVNGLTVYVHLQRAYLVLPDCPLSLYFLCGEFP